MDLLKWQKEAEPIRKPGTSSSANAASCSEWKPKQIDDM